MKIFLKSVEEFQKMLIVKGFSIRSFAKEAGLSHPTVVQIIKGYRNPGPKTAQKIAAALDVNFDDIFFIKNVHQSEQKEKNKNTA